LESTFQMDQEQASLKQIITLLFILSLSACTTINIVQGPGSIDAPTERKITRQLGPFSTNRKADNEPDDPKPDR
jgi:hypothetical protein